MIEQIAVGGLDDNFSYVIHDGEVAAIVDPSGDIEKVFAVIDTHALKVNAVLLTHSHHDHHDRLASCLEKYDVPVYAHSDAKDRIGEVSEFRAVSDGDIIAVGELELHVLHTPGHISDAVCLYVDATAGDGIPRLITGDTLFVEGCGRVWSEEGAEEIYQSLQRLMKLPDETKIFPGHDYGSKPVSTISWEKEHNRFFLAKNLEDFKKERLG